MRRPGGGWPRAGPVTPAPTKALNGACVHHSERHGAMKVPLCLLFAWIVLAHNLCFVAARSNRGHKCVYTIMDASAFVALTISEELQQKPVMEKLHCAAKGVMRTAHMELDRIEGLDGYLSVVGVGFPRGTQAGESRVLDGLELLQHGDDLSNLLGFTEEEGHDKMCHLVQSKHACKILKEELSSLDAGLAWRYATKHDRSYIKRLRPDDDSTSPIGLFARQVLQFIGFDAGVSEQRNKIFPTQTAQILVRRMKNIIWEELAKSVIRTPRSFDLSLLPRVLEQDVLPNKGALAAFAKLAGSGYISLHDAVGTAMDTLKRDKCVRPQLIVISSGHYTDYRSPVEHFNMSSHHVHQFQGSVTRTTVYLSATRAKEPTRLFDKVDERWPLSKQRMFHMSSQVRNDEVLVATLGNAGWTLPISGVSRLFFHTSPEQLGHVVLNSLGMGDDGFSKYFYPFYWMGRESSAAENMASKNAYSLMRHLSAEAYRHKYLKDTHMQAPLQVGGTCYAHASATVFHMAMKRVMFRARTGSLDPPSPRPEDFHSHVPSFEDLKEHLIKKLGSNGVKHMNEVFNTMLHNRDLNLRLHYREVDEEGARRAINARRPVIAAFYLSTSQWDKFGKFYKRNPSGILKSKHLAGKRKPGEEWQGHAVTLVGIAPESLTFMNSWGEQWADQGFFRVANAKVLSRKFKMLFYDVYWTVDDLLPEEIAMFHDYDKVFDYDCECMLPQGL